MKRSEAKWTVLVLAVLLLLTQGSGASEKKKANKGPKAPAVEGNVASGFVGGSVIGGVFGTVAGYTVVPNTAAEVDQQLVKDLVEIINSTESSTTFALTVMALEQLGDKAKATVPSIIRNAERLKIFSSSSAVATPNTAPTKKQQLANAVAQSVVNLLNGNRTPPPPVAQQPCYPCPTYSLQGARYMPPIQPPQIVMPPKAAY